MPDNIIERTRRRLEAEFKAREVSEAEEPVAEVEAEPELAPVIALLRDSDKHRTLVQRIIEDTEGEDLETVLAKYPASYLARKYRLDRSTLTKWKQRLGWKVVGGLEVERVNIDDLEYKTLDKRFRYVKETTSNGTELQAEHRQAHWRPVTDSPHEESAEGVGG
jgi:transposase-like protein